MLACGCPVDAPPAGDRNGPAAAAPGPTEHVTADATADATDDSGPKAMGQKLYSQQDEELIIRHFFRDRRDGVFVDVGAGHHQRYSTTMYLERHLGWKGIAVDGIGEYAEGYRQHRPGTTFVHRLVGDVDGEIGTLYRSNRLPEVSSVTRKVAQDQALKYRGDPTVTEVRVPMSTLNTILTEHGVERIDFLSMDIEEHEPAALAGFDISRFRPELVCIEAHETVREPILRYFTENGYVRIDAYLEHDPNNWYFRPRER